MRNKSCWQDWIVLTVILAVSCLILSAGCERTRPPEAYPCGPKVLIFHAEWCRWCPTTDEIIALQNDFPHCEIVDVDIDVYPELKAEYHVTKIPRFFLCTPDGGCQTTTSFVELKGWLRDL